MFGYDIILNLNFKVQDLLKRWDTEDEATIKQAITKSIKGTSRTIVFVGDKTHKSYWVPHEVQMTTVEQLKHEKFLYLTDIKPYDSENKFPALVERIEGLISKENSSWSQSVKQITKGDKKN